MISDYSNKMCFKAFNKVPIIQSKRFEGSSDNKKCRILQKSNEKGEGKYEISFEVLSNYEEKYNTAGEKVSQCRIEKKVYFSLVNYEFRYGMSDNLDPTAGYIHRQC